MKRLFERLEQKKLTVNRFRTDSGSCQEDIVDEVWKYCWTFYIHANCSACSMITYLLSGDGRERKSTTLNWISLGEKKPVASRRFIF